MKITIDLTAEQEAAFKHWHDIRADFGEVLHETGYDLVAFIDQVAGLVGAESARKKADIREIREGVMSGIRKALGYGE